MIKLPEHDEQGVAYPWKDEPDFAYFTDQDTGLNYFILRNLDIGILCGYVIVTKEEIELLKPKINDFDVHWGVSFCDRLNLNYAKSILKHINVSGSVFAIGFDCGHAYDLLPFRFAKEFSFLHSKESFTFQSKKDIYKDIKFVQNECKKLAVQVADFLKTKEVL